MRECERVEELELVVEVVLEPEHHVRAAAQRLDELPVALLERGEDRLAAPPTAVREEPGPHVQQLRPRNLGHRPLVERVLPRQHRAAKRRLPQRAPGALPVRDVQKRGRRTRLPALPGDLSNGHARTIEPAML